MFLNSVQDVTMAIQIMPSHMSVDLSMQRINSTSYSCFKLIQNNLLMFFYIKCFWVFQQRLKVLCRTRVYLLLNLFQRSKFYSSTTSLHPPTLKFKSILSPQSYMIIMTFKIIQSSPKYHILNSFNSNNFLRSNYVQSDSYFDKIPRQLYTKVRSHHYLKLQVSQN